LLIGAVSSRAITGTNIGGWMVLEPWITPSLFYRFLNKGPTEAAMDCYTLCTVLGPVEGNKLMRNHWDTWYTEEDIKGLADRGVEMVRLPIGDWTLNPYGPYVGCMDGAADKIQWMFDMCAKYNIKILLDVHAVKDSQNGFDNSGETSKLEWKDNTHFSHWPNAQANWIGNWDIDAGKYTSINQDNINLSLKNSQDLLNKWGTHAAFGAFQPVNEPWWNTPLDPLKTFYREVRKMVQAVNKDAKFVFHNSFRYDVNQWNDLFADDDIENVVMDHHYYQAWNTNMNTVKQLCDDAESNANYADSFKYEVWFGEWSLATDVCAHWLGGFNDGNTDPQFTCQ
jgi:glucan 1,3-beta-glucosidase